MPPVVIAAGIGAVGAIGGGLIASSGAKKAASAQTAAAQAGVAEQARQYDLARADSAPWRIAGGNAITQGAAMLQPGYNYQASPSYQWRLNQGLGAVQNSAAAKGMLMSGGTLKDLNNYAQGAASADFGDSFNRQMAIAGGGQQAVSQLGQLGQAAAQNTGSLLTQAGNAKASGYIGQSNAISGMLGSLGSIGMGLYQNGAFGGGSGNYGFSSPTGYTSNQIAFGGLG